MHVMCVNERKESAFETLKIFDAFCAKNGLTYYLAGGTLLGAVRHKGFIPWDDDIDLIMPRPDYMKFIKLSGGRLENNRRVVCPYINTEDNIGSYIQIQDMNTIVESNVYRISVNMGVWVDIFPLDGLSNSKIMRDLKFRKIRIILDLYYAYLVKIGGSRRNKVIDKLQYLVKPFLPVIYSMKKEKILKYIDMISRRYSYFSSQYVGVLVGRAGKKEAMMKSHIEPHILVEFCGSKFPAMKNYDEYLTNLYGNYMIPPPKRKRESRHDVVVYRKGV